MFMGQIAHLCDVRYEEICEDSKGGELMSLQSWPKSNTADTDASEEMNLEDSDVWNQFLLTAFSSASSTKINQNG